MVRIVVDAMGSDNFPVPDVEGAVQAAREYGVEIILVGDESIIKPVLDKQDTTGLNIRIVDAPEMLTMEDKGEKLVLKARSKDAKNSMAVGIDLVKKGEADAFDGRNLGLHEMAHALWLENRIYNAETDFLEPTILARWKELARIEADRINNDKPTFFRKYAGRDQAEFFAVAVEYFFEKPGAFKQELPELYSALAGLLKQDPTTA